MYIGVSIRLTRVEIEQAIRELIIARMAQRKGGVSVDELGFLEKAKVHFLTAEGEPVPLDYVNVTLET
jgi:hypothetical protein